MANFFHCLASVGFANDSNDSNDFFGLMSLLFHVLV
jgi:hypothetical protein